MVTIRDLTAELFRDKRGWVANPIPEEAHSGGSGHVHIASLSPGAVRGNHLHKHTRELAFVWGGKAVFRWQAEDGKIEDVEVGDDRFLLFDIPPGIPHAIKNLSGNDIYLHAYYCEGRSSNDLEECTLL